MSKLADKLSRGDFVVTSELTPPKGIKTRTMLEKAVSLKD